MSIQAWFESMDFPPSFASRRQRPSHAKMRDPASGEDFEAFCVIGTLDDLKRPLSNPVECAPQFRPGIGTIGEQMAQPGTGVAYGFQHRPIAVLNIGCMDDQPEEHTGGIGNNMAFAALDLLPGVIAANPPVVFTVWLSITPAVGLGARPSHARACQMEPDRLSQPVVALLVEIALHC